VRGFSSAVVADLMKFENFKIAKSTLELITNTSTSYDAVVFFCDAILRVVSLNSAIQQTFLEVISSNLDLIKSIIAHYSSPSTLSTTVSSTVSSTQSSPQSSSESSPQQSSSQPSAQSSPPSVCQLHSAILLVDGLVKRSVGIPDLVKPLILDCLSTFFKVKLGNVIHSTIAGILVTCMEQQHKELVDVLVNEGHLVERVLEFGENTGPAIGYHGHLMLIAKFMNTCPLLEEKLLGNEKWQQFVESSVKDYMNKSICPPDAALLAAKQRQIQKAGGSFLG